MSSIAERLKNFRLVRKMVYCLVGLFSYPGLTIVNKLKISGTEHLHGLPRKKVLFVSNHQTYFADVITFLHIFAAVKWGKKNKLGLPYYLLNPFTNVYYVAAEETMKGSFISRLFTLGGALTVKRTWNKNSTEIRRGWIPRIPGKLPMRLNELGNYVPSRHYYSLCPWTQGYRLNYKTNKTDRNSGSYQRLSKGLQQTRFEISQEGNPINCTIQGTPEY